MKKLVFASVMALASLSLVIAPVLRAQDSITIKDPAEFNNHQTAEALTDPAAKAAALESFLQTYPQSVAKAEVLDALIDTYQALNDPEKTLGAASRLLQVDPNNMKAIFISVLIKNRQCAKSVDQRTGLSTDPPTCDDAAMLAHKGLLAPKPASTAADDWKKLTGGTYPIFHSAIALDDIVSKKDVKGGISEYRTELMLYPPEQTTVWWSQGLWDTLQLAEAYTKPEGKDLAQAVWFYARAWNYATPIKAAIEKKMNYYYNKYHGGMDGLDAIKAQAANTVFPAGTFVIPPAATPAEQAHKAILETPDLNKMALVDTEFILANGAKEDTDKLWAVLKDQITPVPGIVIEAPVSTIKVGTIVAGKSADFVVKLKAPMACKDIPEATAGVQAKKDFILSNGVKDDTDKIESISPGSSRPATKITVEGAVSQIKVAVTQDMKAAKAADFIVNMKVPVACKEAPDAGFEYKIPPATTLVGTYDSFTQVSATATMAQTAQIVLRDGDIQVEKKRPVTPAHKPAAGHPAAHPAAH